MWPPRAAAAVVAASHGMDFDMSSFRTAVWPAAAAAVHMVGLWGQR
jgi:hypothetical protein